MNANAPLHAKRVLLQCLICVFFLQPLSAAAASVSYQYDARHRLTGASYDSGVAISYTYDAAGNRLKEVVASSDPDASSDTLASLNKSARLNSSANKNSGSGGSAGLLVSGLRSGGKNGAASGQESDSGKDSTPFTRIHEDAEHGNTARWVIYGTSSGAYVSNIYDGDRGSRVIELSGDGLLNGYVLLNEDGSWWNDSDHKVIQWSMKYADDFVVSVAVLTTGGLRYLSFTPEEADALGTGADIFLGLGAVSKNGAWRTYVIDLGEALHEAHPDTTLLSLLGFSIRGSGLVDDIQVHKEIPAGQDYDAVGFTE